VVMHDGAVVQTGTPEELFERPAHTFVGHFIGSPGMNILPCRVEGATAFIGSTMISLKRAYRTLSDGEHIELGIRPEFVRLQPKGAGLPVQVRRIDDIGRARIARVEMNGRPLAASIPDDISIDGSEASLVLDPNHVHIYANGHLVSGEATGGHAA
jgi:glycerol transport system ATP-binding protein